MSAPAVNFDAIPEPARFDIFGATDWLQSDYGGTGVAGDWRQTASIHAAFTNSRSRCRAYHGLAVAATGGFHDEAFGEG